MATGSVNEAHMRYKAIQSDLLNSPQWLDAIGAVRLWLRATLRDSIADVENDEVAGVEATRSAETAVIARRLEKRLQNIVEKPSGASADAFAALVASESLDP